MVNRTSTVVIAAIFAALSATAAVAATVYENDFASRTSGGAVPYGGWRAVNYVAGQLLANTNWALATMFDYDDLQDNWIKASNTCRNNAYVDDDDGNYVARLGDDLNEGTSGTRKTGPYVIVRQRIGNTFTNGTVTLTFDMRPPSAWYFHSTDVDYLRHCRLYLGSDAMYWNTPSEANTVCRMGVTYRGSLNGRRVFYRDDSAEDVVVSNAVVTSGNWLRYVANVDLDSRKWRFSCYDLGVSHPTLEMATPATALYSSEELEFMGSSVTSISAIAIDGYAILAGNSAARFDNIRIAHNGTECYVNDFSTRRSRSLAESAASAPYSAERTYSAFSYPVTNDVLYRANYDTPDKTMTIAGFDAWKRRHSSTKPALEIVRSKCLSFNTSNSQDIKYGIAAHPIGSSESTGILKFVGDICAPSSWFGSIGRYAFFALGGDYYYTASTSSESDKGQFTRVGLTENGVFHRTQNKAETTNVVAITKSKWYRVVITADLDNKKIGYKVYYMGDQPKIDDAETGDPIANVSGVNPIYDVAPITCYGVASYGGVSPKFDNIRIWHRPSGSTEEDFDLIYQNSFSSRVVYRHEESMIGTLKSEPTGMDGWTRLGASANAVRLASDGNAALVFGNGDETYATAVHDLGGLYKNGAMLAQADICAPTAWQSAGGCANVWFGGDQYHEGNLNGGAYNYEKMAAFGFGITNTTFAAFRGDRAGGGAWETSGTAAPGHWYRFVVASENKASDVSVYDMGTDQPTLATATPATPVATFSGLPFRSSHSSVSCVGVSAMGVKNPEAWSHLLQGGTDSRLMVDNIKFSHVPSGTTISIR